jgi:hypothetical protein
MVSARRFRELGISAAKELPESLPPASVDIREPRTPELRVPTQESLLRGRLVEIASLAESRRVRRCQAAFARRIATSFGEHRR